MALMDMNSIYHKVGIRNLLVKEEIYSIHGLGKLASIKKNIICLFLTLYIPRTFQMG